MHKLLFLLCCVLLSQSISAQEHKSIRQVKAILLKQADHWNRGDIDAFMDDYWKSDKLQFIGSKGVIYGWQATKESYKKNYPDKATMGFLTFDILDVTRLSRKAIMMTGKFHLKRDMGDAEGHFLVIWRKINGRWLMVADHSS
jgi:ketosteroid isomerase-like protein